MIPIPGTACAYDGSDEMRRLVAVTKRMLGRSLARAERKERQIADLLAEADGRWNESARNDCLRSIRDCEREAGDSVAEALRLQMELARMGVEL